MSQVILWRKSLFKSASLVRAGKNLNEPLHKYLETPTGPPFWAAMIWLWAQGTYLKMIHPLLSWQPQYHHKGNQRLLDKKLICCRIGLSIISSILWIEHRQAMSIRLNPELLIMLLLTYVMTKEKPQIQESTNCRKIQNQAWWNLPISPSVTSNSSIFHLSISTQISKSRGKVWTPRQLRPR